MADELTYRSFAKINLFLEVLDRRDDGYHNIETVFQTVGLYDELTFAFDARDISIETNSQEIPVGPENIIAKAADLLRRRSGCTAGVRIDLKKNIPVAAGLAGGSGNAAATLLALNELWGLDLSGEELQGLALELGSDVPYCLLGGTVAATGRGEIMEQLTPIPDTSFLLVHAPITISTASVYNHPSLQRKIKSPDLLRTPEFERAVAAVAAGDVTRAVFNRMQEVVFEDHPELQQLRRRMLDAGCAAVCLSGSGPTLFGVCEETKMDHQLSIEVSTSIVQSVRNGVQKIE